MGVCLSLFSFSSGDSAFPLWKSPENGQESSLKSKFDLNSPFISKSCYENGIGSAKLRISCFDTQISECYFFNFAFRTFSPLAVPDSLEALRPQLRFTTTGLSYKPFQSRSIL
ncbi:hypothetical protein PM082_001973 [Marasmius tenuissimus]|nr:hypothetical protein PM082_001973 [Marasmius tenuissimus]